MSSVKLTGLESALSLLERLGSDGDRIAQQAGTAAARDLRNTWLQQQLTGATGIPVTVVQKAMRVQPANNQYPDARINFSSSGILARQYIHRTRLIDARHNRAQIIVNWIGGTKVAAGFINPLGRRKQPLSTRNQKTTKNGKTYTYRNGVLADAMGPSIATAYQALPVSDVEQAAQQRLAERVLQLLDSYT